MNEKNEFDASIYITSDPFNQRYKVFKQDKTFRVPGKHGKIYDFKSGNLMVFNRPKRICTNYKIDDINTAPFLQ